MTARNPQLVDLGSAANRARAVAAGHQQSVLAQKALTQLQSDSDTAGRHRQRWMAALEHRINHPDSTLAELGSTMTPALTKHAYAALLRRALRGGGITRTPGAQRGQGRRHG